MLFKITHRKTLAFVFVLVFLVVSLTVINIISMFLLIVMISTMVIKIIFILHR